MAMINPPVAKDTADDRRARIRELARRVVREDREALDILAAYDRQERPLTSHLTDDDKDR